MKLIKFRRVFAIVTLVLMMTVFLATAVCAATETAPDQTDYDTAVGYLDEYTTNSGSDENFEENSKTALQTVRADIILLMT